MRKRAGLTLIELLVVLVMISFVVAAAGAAFSVTIHYQQRQDASRDLQSARASFEKRLTDLIRGAEVSASATNNASFFIGQSGNVEATGSATGAAGGVNQIGGLPGAAADTLVFTTFSVPVNEATLSSTDDWQTLNENHGPQGGVTEVQVGTTPVGDAADKTGLFLREQTPADGDPSQGGNEALLNAEISSIQFEFFDGQDWQEVWDTRSQSGTRRIPAAVRVTYLLNGETDETQKHTLIIQLPNSDVTSANPVTVSTGQ